MSDSSTENHTTETVVVRKSNPLYKLGFWLLFIMLILSSVAFGAYWYGQQSDQPQVALNLKSTSPTAQPSNSPIAVSPSPSGSPVASPTPTFTQPVVVFESKGSIPANDLTQLNNRIVNPIVDYYKEHPGEGPVVSLTISPSDKPTKAEFPYLGSIIFKNGGNAGFVISKKDGEIGWWGPDCMKCTFSAEYKSKYPEITKNYQ